MENFEGGNMQKESAPKHLIEAEFHGVDMPGVPPGKGLLKIRFFTQEQNENAIILEARSKHPEIPENVRCTVKELPPGDPFARY
jgi:hypothetical protein